MHVIFLQIVKCAWENLYIDMSMSLLCVLEVSFWVLITSLLSNSSWTHLTLWDSLVYNVPFCHNFKLFGMYMQGLISTVKVKCVSWSYTHLSRMSLLKIECDMDKLSDMSSSSDIVHSGCSSNSQDCLHLLRTFKPVWVHECFRIITVFHV